MYEVKKNVPFWL